MKKSFVFAAFLSLFVLATAASAQKATNFGGTWTLDVSKSKLGDRNNIESQTLTVTQTDSTIKIETATKRAAPPAGAPAGGGGGGMGRGGGGDNTTTYTLDGKATTVNQDIRGTSVPVSYIGKWDGSNLALSRSFTMTTPNGDVTSSTKETWSLGSDGTLTINRESTSPRRTNSTTMVYTKNK